MMARPWYVAEATALDPDDSATGHMRTSPRYLLALHDMWLNATTSTIEARVHGMCTARVYSISFRIASMAADYAPLASLRHHGAVMCGVVSVLITIKYKDSLRAKQWTSVCPRYFLDTHQLHILISVCKVATRHCCLGHNVRA